MTSPSVTVHEVEHGVSGPTPSFMVIALPAPAVTPVVIVSVPPGRLNTDASCVAREPGVPGSGGPMLGPIDPGRGGPMRGAAEATTTIAFACSASGACTAPIALIRGRLANAAATGRRARVGEPRPTTAIRCATAGGEAAGASPGRPPPTPTAAATVTAATSAAPQASRKRVRTIRRPARRFARAAGAFVDVRPDSDTGTLWRTVQEAVELHAVDVRSRPIHIECGFPDAAGSRWLRAGGKRLPATTQGAFRDAHDREAPLAVPACGGARARGARGPLRAPQRRAAARPARVPRVRRGDAAASLRPQAGRVRRRRRTGGAHGRRADGDVRDGHRGRLAAQRRGDRRRQPQRLRHHWARGFRDAGGGRGAAEPLLPGARRPRARPPRVGGPALGEPEHLMPARGATREQRPLLHLPGRGRFSRVAPRAGIRCSGSPSAGP